MVKKYVLTGGPGAGKTSLLICLEILGEPTIREAAEDLIRYQQAKGVALPQAHPDFEENILKLQLSREANIAPTLDRVFIDRGLLDTFAYSQLFQRSPSKLMQSVIQRFREEKIYEKIFIVEHQGLIASTASRRETLDQALSIEKLQEANYREFGYEIIRVPFGEVAQRRDIILSNL